MAQLLSDDEFLGTSSGVPNRNSSDAFLSPGAGNTAEQRVQDIEQSNAPDADKKAARAALEAGRRYPTAGAGKLMSDEEFLGKAAAPAAKPAPGKSAAAPSMVKRIPGDEDYFDPLAAQNERELARTESIAPAPERGVLAALKGRGSLSPTGILKNMLTRSALPAELKRMWTQDSVLAHLDQAYKQGKLGETLGQIANSPMVLAKEFPNFSYQEVWDAAKENPRAMMGGLIDSVVADPVLAFVPFLREGKLAQGLAVTGSRLGRAGEVAGRAAGRAAEIGGSAGAIVAPISVADQMATQGYVDPKQLVQDVGMGVGLGTAVAVGANLGGAILKIRPRELYNDWRQRVSKGTEPGPAMDEALQAAGLDGERAAGIGDAIERSHEEQFAEAMMPKAPEPEPELSKQELAERKRMAKERLQQEVALQEARQTGEAETATAQAAVREANQLASASPIERFPQTGANVLEPNVPAKTPLSVGVMLGSADAARAKPGFKRTAEDILALRRESRLAAERFAGLARTWSKDPRMQAAIALGLSAPFWDEMSQEQLAGLGAAGAVLAVKPAGGMWHPEAVRRLSTPLRDSLADSEARAAFVNRQIAELKPGEIIKASDLQPHPATAWADRAVKNYLNRYAGTDRDPLKDVRIPVGQEMKRWEEVTDAAISATPAGVFLQRAMVAGARPDEPIYDFTAGGRLDEKEYATRALTSYLSHVGDYLRAHVPPERLQQYDLVRAVRETAANDERVAREAVKGFAAESAARVPAQDSMPTFKTYGEVDLPKRTLELNKAGSKRQMQSVELPAERVTMEWKELALPKELTPEQAKTVRQATIDEVRQHQGENYAISPGRTPDYIALDVQGKPIKDNFSGDLAIGQTPQEAWLAGQLALEGNVMGHCVGGYCGGVTAGEQRILSLRDSKGRSYATVELQPRRQPPDLTGPELVQAGVLTPEQGAQLGDAFSREDLLRVAGTRNVLDIYDDPRVITFAQRAGPDNIAQIKGPGNAAPPEYVLPYVQDLVKGGKWGEVRDLENAGLFKFGKHYVSPEDLAKSAGLPGKLSQAKEFLQGILPSYELVTVAGKLRKADEVFQEALDKLAPSSREGGRWPPRGERGSVDPGLLMRLGALGLGGYIGAQMTKDNPLVGGGAGALAVLAAGRSKGLMKSLRGLGQHALQGADYGLGLGLTRLENIHPALRWRAEKFERDAMLHAHEYLGRVDQFLVGLEKLPSAQKKDLGLELRSEDPARIAAALKRVGNLDLVKGWGELQRVMKELGADLKEKGFLKELGEIYLPRIVKDRAGLLKELESVVNEARAKGGRPEVDLELKTKLEERIHDATNAALQSRGYGLTDIEESAIIGRYLKEFIPGYGQPGFAKARHIKEITERLEPFYAGLAESVHTYVKSAVGELEKAKFFGDDLRMKKKGGQLYVNEDASIQSLLQNLLKKGQITHEQVPEVRDLLKSRFRMKETGPITQGLKDIGYLALLTDAGAAVMQSGDSVMAAYHHGLRPMLEGLVRSLTGQKFVDWREFGGADLISAEFANTRTTSRWLNKAMKPMFFQVDLLGKNANLNAAVVKLRNLAQSEKGLAKLQERFGQALSDEEFKQLVGDLKNRRDTDLLRQVLFSELGKAQPISKFDLPRAYQDRPSGRLLYQLHLWQLKQFDIARRDSYNEIKSGNLGKGIAKMTALLTVLGISGATSEQLKNFIFGRPLDISLGSVMDNALRTFGWSQYMQEQVTTGQTQKAAGNIALPVHFRIWDDIQKGGDRWIKYVFPWFGRTLWEHSEEGKAVLAKQEASKERKERLEGRMSSEEWRKRKEELRR